MTVFNTGYSSFSYEPVPSLARLWPLARMEFLKLFRKRLGLLAFFACVAYYIVKLVIIWVRLGAESQESEGMQMMGAVSPKFDPFHALFYADYSTQIYGVVPFLLLTCLVSVRSISGDKAVNALEIYWTRGISPWGYFLGKWFGSFLLLSSVFVAGPLVLWGYGMLAAPDTVYFVRTVAFMPAVLLALTMKCAILSFLAVGFSALAASANVATFLWLVVMLGTTAVGRVLTEFHRLSVRRTPEVVVDSLPWYKAICPWDAMARIEQYTTGLAKVAEYPVWKAWVCLAVLIALLMYRLGKQLRTTGAVA